MTVIRRGGRFRLHDPGRGGCGDCPGFETNPSSVPPPTSPISPPDFDTSQDIAILDGFEHDPKYISTDGSLYGSLTPVALALVPETRGGKTAGRALEITATTSQGSIVSWGHKTTGQTYQYFRVYFKITSFQNTNAFNHSYTLVGWIDSSGVRYSVQLIFPGVGGLGALLMRNDLPGGGGQIVLSVALQAGVYYRLEFIQESIVGPDVICSVFLYDADTNTLIDSGSGNVGPPIALGGFPFLGQGQINHAGNALTIRFDDVRIQTGRPSIPVSARLGPLWGAGGVWPMYPGGAITSQWTPLSGLNYTQVDEFPPAFDDETSYVSSTGAGATLDDLYVALPYDVYQVVPPGGITAVQVRPRFRNAGGIGPILTALYQDPLDTIFTGAGQGADDNGWINYPAAQQAGVGARCPHAFLTYPTPLDTSYKLLQGLGVRRGSVNSGTVRVTSVWGWMDVRAS